MTATMNLKDQIRKLILLQQADAEIYTIKQELHERPLEIEQLRVEFEAKKVKLKALEDRLKTLQVGQKNLDNDLKSKEEAIAKADASLGLLKTNKEYTTRLHEIENLKADKSQVEEKLLMGMDEVEAARKAVDAERSVVTQYEKDFLSRKKTVEESMALMQDQLHVKETQRKALTPEVRSDVMAKYDRILAHKQGVAIVPIQNNACGGCYMHVTEQLLNQVKICDQLVFCDQCARLLYLADEL